MFAELTSIENGESSEAIRTRILVAREIQAKRFQKSTSTRSPSSRLTR